MTKAKQPPAPPVAIEAEQATLGAILMNADAIAQVAPFLKPEHFSDRVHARLYEIMRELHLAGKRADFTSVRIYLPAGTMVTDDVSLPEYLANLAAQAVSSNARDYGQAVHDMAIRRALMGIAERLIEAAATPAPEVTPAELVSSIESDIADLRAANHVGRSSSSFAAEVERSREALDAAVRRQAPVGYPWPLTEIEHVVDGRLEAGNVVGLLGASGDGKTSITLQILRHAAEQGVPCLFLTGEQTPMQCTWQLHAQRLSIAAKSQKEGRISEDEYAALIQDKRDLAALPLELQIWSGLRIAQIKTRVRAFVKRFGPGVIALDHVKKIEPDYRNDIMAQQIFQVYEGVKDCAVESGCAFLLLMQRNSEFLSRPVARPVRRDVYGGEGALQNLDSCFAIFRPDIWLKERYLLTESQKEKDELARKMQEQENAGELYGLKARFGERNRQATIGFEPQFTRFRSIVRRDAYHQEDMLDDRGG